MPSYKYRPGHPMADKDGFVDSTEYALYETMTKPDMRMMNGNEPVTLRFISDEMPSTRHMSNGKYYTSKKKFRDETRARGCIEVGDQTHYLGRKKVNTKGITKKDRVEDIKKAIYQLTGKA